MGQAQSSYDHPPPLSSTLSSPPLPDDTPRHRHRHGQRRHSPSPTPSSSSSARRASSAEAPGLGVMITNVDAAPSEGLASLPSPLLVPPLINSGDSPPTPSPLPPSPRSTLSSPAIPPWEGSLYSTSAADMAASLQDAATAAFTIQCEPCDIVPTDASDTVINDLNALAIPSPLDSRRSASHPDLVAAAGATPSDLATLADGPSTTASASSNLAAPTSSRSLASRLSPQALACVSEAIHNAMHSRCRSGTVEPSDSVQEPTSPKTAGSLTTQDQTEQKLILLRCLFQAIDHDSNGYLQRDELLEWISNEPWLTQPELAEGASRLVESVSHDEDSRCSRTEFLKAFDGFTTADVVNLIVNLLRAGMISKVPKLTYVYNDKDFYLNGILQQPEESPEPGMHGQLSHHDTTADALLTGQNREEAEKHFFLLDVLFNAMDRDLDGELDEKDVGRWLMADVAHAFLSQPDNHQLFEAVDACWQELQRKNEAAGFNHLPSDTTAPVGPARIDRHFFFLQFSQIPKRLVRRLLVHLLSRNAASVMDQAQQHREEERRSAPNSPFRRAADGTLDGVGCNQLLPACGTTALPVPPFSLLTRRFSVVVDGARRVSVPSGLRLTLTGQTMLQHDIRKYEIGRETIATMRELLRADVVFSELETAILKPGRTPQKQRNTIFFHAADPAVIDCLVELGCNMVATANNHAGDLGLDGLETIMEEFAARNICMAGVGKDARQAAQPAFLDTPNGRVAQVAFASKIPEHSRAQENRAGVNPLRMIDVDTHKLNPVHLQRILSSIESAREGFVDPVTHEHHPRADLIIAYHHNHYWEKNAVVNRESKMGRWKRDLAHMLIDAGANIYIAHGDPRLQGIEIYRGCPIFYCLGNFVFQTKTEIGFYGQEVWQSVIVHLHCNEIGVDGATSYSVKLTPIVLNERGVSDSTHLQTRGLPRLADRAEGLRILLRLQHLSAEFGTRIRIEDRVEEDPAQGVIGWVMGLAEQDGEKEQVGVEVATAQPKTDKQYLEAVEQARQRQLELQAELADAKLASSQAFFSSPPMHDRELGPLSPTQQTSITPHAFPSPSRKHPNLTLPSADTLALAPLPSDGFVPRHSPPAAAFEPPILPPTTQTISSTT